MYIRLFYWTYLDTMATDEDDQPPARETTTAQQPRLNERLDMDKYIYDFSKGYSYSKNHLPSITSADKYHTTTFHGNESSPKLPSVIINEDNISDLSFDGAPYQRDQRTPWGFESKSRSESCLSDGYFSSGANGAFSVNTAYSELE